MSGTRAPCSSTGSTHGTRAAASSSGSRTPTGSGRPRRRSSRPRTSCAGSGSTGTRARTARRSGFDLYAAAAAELVESGAAYPCYCTAEELAAERERRQAEGLPLVYSGRCRTLTADERTAREGAGLPHVIRLAMPADGTSAIDDVVRGHVEWENALLGDHVIFRSDGTPTYLFANPFDDIAMGITHVIRGEDLLPSTPRQLARLRGAGRRAADVRPPADGARHRQEEALQAPRRGLGRGVPRPRGRPAGARQLPGARRLELRRPHDDDDRPGAGRAVLARARELEPGRVRSREARVAERRAPAGAPARRLRGVAPAYLEVSGSPLADAAGAGGRGGPDRPGEAPHAGPVRGVRRLPVRPGRRSIPTHGLGSRPTPPRRGGSPRRATRSPGWRRGGPRRSMPPSPPHARRRARSRECSTCRSASR